MRAINSIIVHHTASGFKTTFEQITSWHKDRGFNTIGYHFVVFPDGKIREGRPVSQIGAHAKGRNADTIGVCVVGNFEELLPTEEATEALSLLLDSLLDSYDLPRSSVFGHRDVGST